MLKTFENQHYRVYQRGQAADGVYFAYTRTGGRLLSQSKPSVACTMKKVINIQSLE
jgi:hypothetical protein